MAINPVVLGPTNESQSPSAESRQKPSPAEPAAASKVTPESGSAAKAEKPPAIAAADLNQLPQDEVQVQRDQSVNNDVVVKYLDHSGNLIVQVPSSEVLGVAQGIDQEFAAEQTSRAKTVETHSADEGDNNHGH